MITTMEKAKQTDNAAVMEKVVIGGDLGKLSEADRLYYYTQVCNSLGLNALTRPFEYIILNGKLTLYARKDCTEQLRNIHGVSVNILSAEVVDGVYVVRAKATMGNRFDESIGAVAIEGPKGDSKANAMMKAETKAKRRVTLSICGLGILDETEVETIHEPEPVVEKPQSEVNQPDNFGLATARIKNLIWEKCLMIWPDEATAVKSLKGIFTQFKVEDKAKMTQEQASQIIESLNRSIAALGIKEEREGDDE